MGELLLFDDKNWMINHLVLNNSNILYQGISRICLYPINQKLHAFRFSFGFNVNSAIGKIPNKTCYFQLGGFDAGELQEEYSLNHPFYPYIIMYFHLPVKFAFRFSMNAEVPSLKSSVAKHFPNSSISVLYPFTLSVKKALTLAMMAVMAAGDWAIIL